MTDPVTAAIITTSGAILVGLITAFVHSRKTHSASQAAPNTLQADATTKPIQSQRSKSFILPDSPKPPTNGSTDLSLMQIVECIERVPPYQTSAVEQTFIGLRVQWRGRLSSISHHRHGTVSVSVNFSDDAHGFCSTRPENLHGLHAAPKGTPLIVSGVLERIGRYEVGLEDCTVSNDQTGNA